MPSPQEYVSFTGIPYARPPVGPLRFLRPAPVEPWGDTVLKVPFRNNVRTILGLFSPPSLHFVHFTVIICFFVYPLLTSFMNGSQGDGQVPQARAVGHLRRVSERD